MNTVNEIKTTDHNEIRQWAEERRAIPVQIALNSTGKQLDTIKFRFPNQEDNVNQEYQEIDWDEFLAIFENYGLAMIYEDPSDNQADATYHRFDHR